MTPSNIFKCVSPARDETNIIYDCEKSVSVEIPYLGDDFI